MATPTRRGAPTVAAHTSHAMRTLRMPYLLADTGVRIDGAPVRSPHAETLKRRLTHKCWPSPSGA
ncbi:MULTISPECIES: hypothetical protein [Streptomyces]|uniref:Uncharacterized protein n=1 Tax=Streptomyces nymphaeiformis TaxID=2663842 RepID=A0A7W7U360_9ACTN|nr:hypothetical protein [Streptomyces nymphaeiformis]MBB4983801.1 hypothetical protein [Streptomyces nymphaeiformis]